MAEFTCPRKTHRPLNRLQSCFSSESSPHPIKSTLEISTVVYNSGLTRQVKRGTVLPNWEALGLNWRCWEGRLGCSHIYLQWNPGCCQHQQQRLARIYGPGVPCHLQKEHTVRWDCCVGLGGNGWRAAWRNWDDWGSCWWGLVPPVTPSKERGDGKMGNGSLESKMPQI